MYEQRSSKLPFIDYVWFAEGGETSDAYDDPAKETWGLAFTKKMTGVYRAELHGPSAYHQIVDSVVGDQYWGVEFYSYVTMRGVNKPELVGKFVDLHVVGDRFFSGMRSMTFLTFEDSKNCAARSPNKASCRTSPVS